MILSNARVVLAHGIEHGLEVICEGGKVTDVCGAQEHTGERIDLRGNYLAAGFVDLHVHGARGRDTMEASAEAFRAVCDYHASGGTTSLLLTTATAAIDEIVAVLREVRRTRAELPQVSGVHVEGPFISRARAGAQREEFIREPDRDSVDRLLEFSDVIERLTLAPELPGALALIAELRDRGIHSSGGHTDAWDEEAQAGFAHGLRSVTHTFNCMSSARRRGRERVAGMLEFALSEPEISCELIADGHHVSDTLMKMLYRAKGADGICLVTDATAGAGLPEEAHFTLAGRECVTRDGACFLADGSTLAGSSARMIDLVRNMVERVGVPLHEAVGMATRNPARCLRSNAKGIIEAGADADFVVLSPQLTVLQTYVAGEKVYG